jgi:superfamily I DNA/RNA helicase
LHRDSKDNLGWHIVIEADQPSFLKDIIKTSLDKKYPLVKLIPESYRQKMLSEAEQTSSDDESISDEPEEANEPRVSIRLTSYEGSKGLSAQHVFVVGLHEGDLPRKAGDITDLEICKFLVALTRTRKQCHLMHTLRWSGQKKVASTFLSWIKPQRLTRIRVDKKYWDLE